MNIQWLDWRRLSCLCVLLVGCEAGPLHDEGWAAARPLGAAHDAYRPAMDVVEAAAPGSAFEALTGVVTARRALAAALVGNPRLESFSWEVRARGARALQAGLWPNPEASVEVEEFGGTGATRRFESAETTVRLSQLIPLGGKIDRRVRAAKLERDLAGWDYEAARLAVATEVARALIDVEAAQRRIDLARGNVELASQVFEATDKKVKAGAVTSLQRTRAGVVLETSRIELRRAERALVSARHRLAATWGSTEPAFERVEAELDEVRPIPGYEEVRARVDQNPQLARWVTEVAHRRAVIALERARGVPDLTAGVGVKRLEESDDTAAVIQFSLPLPIFDRNRGGVLEARYALARARADERAAQVAVRTLLAQAYQELDAAYVEAISLRDTVLPAARTAFEATNKAYEAGQISYLDVLDAQRSWFEARDRYIQMLAAYHGAVAEVEGLTGQALGAPAAREASGNEQQPSDGDQP